MPITDEVYRDPLPRASRPARPLTDLMDRDPEGRVAAMNPVETASACPRPAASPSRSGRASASALAAGRQSLILRKGGIDEGPGGFLPEHPAFWLYPTRVHQAEQGLKPEARPAADAAAARGYGRPRRPGGRRAWSAGSTGEERLGGARRPARLDGRDGRKRFHYRQPGPLGPGRPGLPPRPAVGRAGDARARRAARPGCRWNRRCRPTGLTPVARRGRSSRRGCDGSGPCLGGPAP